MKDFLHAATFSALVLASGQLGAQEDSMMSSRPASPSAPLSRSEEILKRFDKNADGRIDEDERADAHDVMLQEQTAKGAALEATRRELGPFHALALEIFDRNRDRQIDANERLDALAFVRQRGDAAMREAILKRFDKNADGTLDETERRDSQTYAEEHRGELMQEVLLKQYDSNGNAQLDADEKAKIQKEFAETVRPSSDRVSVVVQPAQPEATTPAMSAGGTATNAANETDQAAALKAEIERRRAVRREDVPQEMPPSPNEPK